MPSRRHPRALPALLAALATLAILLACQETPEPTAPDRAVAVVQKTLTVKGSGGNGIGVVTSSPAGINCTITAGVAATTGCSARFTQGAVVTMTPTPLTGHAFKSWFNACAGAGSCQVSMTVNRTVAARFLKGPFTRERRPVHGGDGDRGSLTRVRG